MGLEFQAWFGVVYILLDLVGLPSWAAKLEDRFGGRVCPMILRENQTAPRSSRP